MDRIGSLVVAAGAAAMVAFAQPAAAQQGVAYLALSDLKTLFVTQQQ